MKAYDVTGSIREGMWGYEPPFPAFRMRPLGSVPWAGCDVYCEVFEGMHSQTGTYLETPAHYYGNGRAPLVADIPVERLTGAPCTLLMVDPASLSGGEGRPGITPERLEGCPGARAIRPGEAVLVGTGWGRRWTEPDYLSRSPFFTLEAMRWLLAKKPFLLGSDFPRWENPEEPQGIFPEFYASGALMLAPCAGLEAVPGFRFALTALPLNIPGTSCAPCRAVLTAEE